MTNEQAAMPVAELARQMRDGTLDRPPITQATADKLIMLLSAMFRWGQSRGYALIEPFKQLTSPGRTQELRRHPFSEADIRAIFSAPLFTGTKDAVHWRQPGSHLVDDHAFWIPLIGLATGMRIEEIGQLMVSDIKNDQGILYLDITETVDPGDIDDGVHHTKHLKTAASQRRVPLHQIVLDAGFEEYIAHLRSTGKRALFPALPATGKKTKNFSRGFTRDFLKSVGITNKSKVFHSFRHLFKDRCRAAELPRDAHHALTGHSSRSVGDTYGLGIAIAMLKQHMDLLTFPGYQPVPRREYSVVAAIGAPLE